MSVRIEIFDGTTPMLEKIQLLSHGMALEVLSVAGSILQKNARNAMKRSSHNWHQIYRNGKMTVKKGELRELGLRINQTTGSSANPDSMSNMITSYLNEKSMVVTIGGRHKSFTPNKRTGGVVTGRLGRINSVGKKTHSIIHKLNFGGYLDKQLPDYERAKNQIGTKHTKYKGYHFMEQGYSESKAAMVDAMTNRYNSLLHKAVNRADVKVRRRKVV